MCQCSTPNPFIRIDDLNFCGMALLQEHFRQDHFLCKKMDCLAKKFIVFASEAELKVCFPFS